MSKLFLLITSAMLGIAGCASHSHMLGQGSAPELLNGELNHIQPSRLVLESKDLFLSATDSIFSITLGSSIQAMI